MLMKNEQKYPEAGCSDDINSNKMNEEDAWPAGCKQVVTVIKEKDSSPKRKWVRVALFFQTQINVGIKNEDFNSLTVMSMQIGKSPAQGVEKGACQ
ncbi:Uncharacterized protein TCM_002667 [Theobroma cacao]|uniref:Uncharacterized protein n=1 Tax=Theobroma cacao TaxID=3641 RepID=A0A061DLT7_THECC|nr:Uncharacterized protein TCM_002667 [Theobroma cacao]